MQCLLRTRYYQRAFRAITTGHSNRRRTQTDDFEALKISFPEDKREQLCFIGRIQASRAQLSEAMDHVKQEMNNLSDLIDGRAREGWAEIDAGESDNEQDDS